MYFCFPDTTVVCNFAAIDRLDLFEAYLHGRGRITEAVAFEIRRSTRYLPHLLKLDVSAVFGEAITIDDEHDVRSVEVTRTSIFGGLPSEPLKHLGESQTLHVLGAREEFRGSTWITDDRQAHILGKKRGFTTRDTVYLLSELVALGELRCDEALAVTEEMWASDRTLLSKPLAPSYFQ